jgi:DNA-binding transcriptional regulator YhcF (GntR family)
MLPFSISLQSGEPLFDQVVYAVTRAVVTGQLRVDDPFPSVRTLSQELKINPNTAHKIVAALIADGLLQVRPGIGTVVAQGRPGGIAARRTLLEDDAERLVVEAKKTGVSLQHVIAAVRRHWNRLVRRTA